MNKKIIIEKKPKTLLAAETVKRGCAIQTKVYNNSKKLTVHWSSKILTKYKHNAITSELHRAKRIASGFKLEVKRLHLFFYKQSKI